MRGLEELAGAASSPERVVFLIVRLLHIAYQNNHWTTDSILYQAQEHFIDEICAQERDHG